MLAGAECPPPGAAVGGVLLSGQSAVMARFFSPEVYFLLEKSCSQNSVYSYESDLFLPYL